MRASVIRFAVCAVAFLGFLEWKYSASALFSLDLNGTDTFALRFFRDFVPVDRTILSKVQSRVDGAGPRCVIAVVRLQDRAPFVPPEVPLADRMPLGLGGNWRMAPEGLRTTSGSDPLVLCADLIPAKVMAELQVALQRPTAFYIRNWRDKVLQIYSHDDLLAAYVHYSASP